MQYREFLKNCFEGVERLGTPGEVRVETTPEGWVVFADQAAA